MWRRGKKKKTNKHVTVSEKNAENVKGKLLDAAKTRNDVHIQN